MSTAEFLPESETRSLRAEEPHVHATFSELFADALRGVPCSVRGVYADEELLPVHHWLRPADRSDRALLQLCEGATMDVGCGPGRMSAYLRELGNHVLAVDIVREAVEQARRRGVPALRRNVFDPMPGEGHWDSVLLADGNIGIGGSPIELLRRCGELVHRSGRVVVDLEAPGTGLRTHEARLVSQGRRTSLFPWAQVGTDAIEHVAASAHLVVERLGEHHGRWFAVLTH
ncbi:Methyltransferase domain-containing protein [Nocardioides scoriae]|uniref:Methyltransferase domain-containing protein n=1 Tax=Nocardioides scoriae TaxID=642780 RepID=A0A1H1RQ66_9ACTN|nr:class I SAM-dependent methyltransferase [Nocardioides scoriae]SDS37860.1 Methyltransferase domain-containing protein [Nocardioides scoriae]